MGITLLGAARPSAPVPVTPGRWTHIRLNVPDTVLIEGPFWLTKFHAEIARTTRNLCENVVYTPGAGWELEAYQINAGAAQERTVAESGIQKPIADGGTLEVPSGILSKNMQRQATELTNAFSGGASDPTMSGYPVLTKEVDTADWSDTKYRLDSDMTAQPNPVTGTTAMLDRWVRDTRGVGVGAFDLDVDDLEDGRAIFTLNMPGSGALAIDTLATITFTAVPRSTLRRGSNDLLSGFVGTGEYMIEFLGSGLAVLWDRVMSTYDSVPASGGPIWVRLKTFRWTPERKTFAGTHQVQIRKVRYGTHAKPEIRNGFLGSILIMVTAAESSSPLAMSSGASFSPTAGQMLKYFVPFTGDSASPPRPVADKPTRIDVRRDQRPTIQWAEARYPATGVVIDDWVSLDGYSFSPADAAARLITVTASGILPPGTAFDLALHAAIATGSADYTVCTPVGSLTVGPGFVTRQFTLPTDRSCNTFRAKVTLKADDYATPSNPHKRTPILERITYAKDAYGTVLADTELDLVGKQTSVSISGVDRDPTTSTATASIDDLADAHSILREQGTFPVQIETEHDQEQLGGGVVDWDTDPDAVYKRTVLFRGYVDKIDATKMGPAPRKLGSALDAVFPSAERRKYDLTMLGMWQRAQEATAPFTASWAQDPSTLGPVGFAKPYPVVTVLRTLFAWMGFPPSMIAIPDAATAPDGLGEVRMWTRPGEADASINAGASLLEYAVEIARSYLGKVIDFCPNSVGWGLRDSMSPSEWQGAWVLLGAPKKVDGDYVPLAKFYSKPPAIGGGSNVSLAHSISAYTVGGVPGAPITRRSFKSRVRRPEANMITVAGTSDGGVFVSDSSASVFAATMINFASYNAYPGLTTAIAGTVDYIGRRISRRYVQEGLIASTEAAQWVCRLVYRWIGLGTKEVSFAAPLVLVWDPNDPCQVRPRPLRYYDPIEVLGVTMLVRSSPAIMYSRDPVQVAGYQAEVPRS